MKRFDAQDTIWLTLTKHVPESIIDEVNLKSSTAFYSGIDVVVHRDQIGIYAKVKVGIYACRYLFLVGLMLLIIYGVTIWFIERWKSEIFSSYLIGIFNGMWLGLVTMTTVGYGDFTPGSVFGKLVTMVWIVFGAILTAILTSTITNAFGGLEYLDISQKQVIARKGSIEAWIAKNIYQADVINVPNYEYLFDNLANKKYSIGVADSYVRSHYLEKFESLRNIKRLQVVNPISELYHKSRYNTTIGLVENCLDRGYRRR